MVEGQEEKHEGLSLARCPAGSHLPGLRVHPRFVLLASDDSLSWGPPLCERHSEDRVSLVSRVATTRDR